MIKILDWILDWFERYWKLPEGSKVAFLTLLIAAGFAYGYQSEKNGRAKDNAACEERIQAKDDTINTMERRHSSDMRRSDSLAYARLRADYEKLEARQNATQDMIDFADKNTTQAIRKQEKNLRFLKKATK